jgi:hypothetical protein
MTIVVKAPAQYDPGNAIRIFLGGSIDMGTAENWQDRLAKDLSGYSDEDLILLNPRRDDWDSSWVQDPTPGTQFYEQVEWELEQQEEAEGMVYYFAADSSSPITLLELGLFSQSNAIVCCPKEFYRYGNVKMVCDRYNIVMVETYEEMVTFIKGAIDAELQG